MFKGLPYINSNVVNTFQVFEYCNEKRYEPEKRKEIILYGKISAGKLSKNDIIKVWGNPNDNGTIIARKVINETTNTVVRINHSINSIVVWAMVIIFGYITYSIITFDWKGLFSNMVSGASLLLQLMLMALFPLIITFIMIKSVFEINKKRGKVVKI